LKRRNLIRLEIHKYVVVSKGKRKGELECTGRKAIIHCEKRSKFRGRYAKEMGSVLFGLEEKKGQPKVGKQHFSSHMHYSSLPRKGVPTLKERKTNRHSVFEVSEQTKQFKANRGRKKKLGGENKLGKTKEINNHEHRLGRKGKR